MSYRFEVIDGIGRRWARTLTAIKAARMVKMLYETRGLVCTVQAIGGTI